MKRAQVAAGSTLALLAGALAVAVPSVAAVDGPSAGWPKAASAASRGAGPSTGSDDHGTDRGRTLRLIGHVEEQVVLDFGDTGPGPGDAFLFEESLRDRQGRVVGRNSVRCQVAVTSQRCEGTFSITGRGSIEVAGGVFDEDQAPVLAVTGGTGDFTGFGGTLGFFPADDPNDAGLVFHLTAGGHVD